MTNPHDTPSRHSKKWDEEEKSNASPPSGTGRSYGGYDSGNYSSGNNPTDWTGGTGRSPYDRKRSRKPAIIIIIILLNQISFYIEVDLVIRFSCFLCPQPFNNNNNNHNNKMTSITTFFFFSTEVEIEVIIKIRL